MSDSNRVAIIKNTPEAMNAVHFEQLGSLVSPIHIARTSSQASRVLSASRFSSNHEPMPMRLSYELKTSDY